MAATAKTVAPAAELEKLLPKITHEELLEFLVQGIEEAAERAADYGRALLETRVPRDTIQEGLAFVVRLADVVQSLSDNPRVDEATSTLFRAERDLKVALSGADEPEGATMPNQPQGETTAEAPTTDERIRVLEEKVDDLASFVGRVTYGAFNKRFDEYDCQDDELLVWKEAVPYSSTEDGEVVGWWTYRAEAVGGDISDAR